MPYLNANTVNEESTLSYDICIIGSGAAGIAVAREFLNSKRSVVMLEAGGIDFEPELQTDYDYEQINGRGGDWEFTRTRQWGGSTAVWYGRCTNLQPIDFEKRDWVANSGWPISHDTVQKYRGRALDTLCVPHPEAIDPETWADSETYKAFSSENINTNVFLWSNPKDMAVAYHEAVEDSKSVTLCYYAFAQEIIPNENDDHVESVRVMSSDGISFSVNAKMIVIAGGSIENSRLLLLSQTNSENGLGNDFDNVGRYYMDHPRIEGAARLCVDKSNSNWRQRIGHLNETMTAKDNVQMFLSLSEEAQRANRLLNHGTVFRAVTEEQLSESFLAAKEIFYAAKGKNGTRFQMKDIPKVVAGLPMLAKTGLKRKLGREMTFSHLILIDQLEQEPDRESRVCLDTRRDRFGQQKAAVKWEIGSSTTNSLRWFHKSLDTHLRNIKLGWIESPLISDPDYIPDYTDACHPTGTTRMSLHPKDGVVNPDCQVHGFNNLFIAGSSVFPTVGYANPTLTLVALAIRLADSIKAKIELQDSPTVIQKN